MTDTALAFSGKADTTMSVFRHGRASRVCPQSECDSSTPSIITFRHLLARYPRSSGSDRRVLRSEIVRRVAESRFSPSGPDPYLQAVLDEMLQTKQVGRLDDAIEILAHAGPELAQFVQEAQLRHPFATTDSNYWYVLIRALGRVPPTPTSDWFIDQALSSRLRPLVEAAVLALAERGDEASRRRLRSLREKPDSPFLRELLDEALADFEDECKSSAHA